MRLTRGIAVLQEEDDDGLDDLASTSEARQYFDGVLAQVPHHLESMLGRAKCCELDKDWAGAMEGLNQVGSPLPPSPPPPPPFLPLLGLS